MAATVEVVVVSYGSAPVVTKLLGSLAAVIPDVPVAIREHSSDPAALAGLRALAAGHTAAVRIEHDPSNPGFGAGCNALARSSHADFLAFLNPDTELTGWPWSHDATPPSATIVGPVMADAPHQHYGRRYRIRDEIALSWLRRRPLRPAGTGYVSGAGLLIERAAFDRIGGFDPAFFLFYEDIDLCLRANAAGIPTIVDERWTMRHARHHSTADRFDQSLIWSLDSALRFYGKHGSPVRAYRAYKAVDASVRAGWHAVRRTGRAGAYRALARRAVSG